LIKPLFFICISSLITTTGVFSQEIVVKFKAGVEFSAKNNSAISSNIQELQQLLVEDPPDKTYQLFRKKNSRLTNPLKNIHILKYRDSQSGSRVMNRLSGSKYIEYTHKNTVYRVSTNPNDTYLSEQWYLTTIKANQAWDFEIGSDSIFIGVIDTGIDYNHEDLQGQLWINNPEDINKNGKFDEMDLNGYDDDGNGYVDDVIGWDFTDAPNFPDQGDFLEPDNDPMDEYSTGHGTPIAGIIAAAQNNNLGISGIAPGIRIMVIRAGTASGFLEEDDVAEAIVYAVDNGCRVINMSFGDVSVSYLIRDAIQYGIAHGVVFVAASGNDGNSVSQYPAAYTETISVGGTNSSDGLASFSSYGNTLDLVAPAQDIFSCQINNEYGSNSGTSFAVPIVCGAIGLIWSKHPEFSPEDVKGALYSGATDLGTFGWDTFYGHGLLNLPTSLSIGSHGYAEILYPSNNRGVSESPVLITGTAYSPSIESYELAFGMGDNPIEWEIIQQDFSNQAIRDTIGLWNIHGLEDTLYTLRLKLNQFNQAAVEKRITVQIDRSPPDLIVHNQSEMLFGPENGYLLEFQSDDDCTAIMYYGNANDLRYSKTSPYLKKEHFFTLSQSEISGEVDYSIEFKNSAGLKEIFDNESQNFKLTIAQTEIPGNILPEIQNFSFEGYFAPELYDFDSDQNKELLLSQLTDTIVYGPLQIWEFENNQPALRMESLFPAIPRDVGDIEGDGIKELLAGFGRTTMILNSQIPGDFPNRIAWIDTINYWGSRLKNLDDDSNLELLALNHGDWAIFELMIPDYHPILKQVLNNDTPGSNRYGVPWSLIDDLDKDGFREIIFGDFDGDVLVFEENLFGDYEKVWSMRMPGIDATYLLESANIDGAGNKELVVVVRNEPENLTESTVVSRYWILIIWGINSDNTFSEIFRKNIHSVSTQRSTFQGLSITDLNNDGISEIFFTPFPRAYGIEIMNNNAELIWYSESINSNRLISSDFNGNGYNEIILNGLDGVKNFEYSLNPNRPLPPAQFSATPLDTNNIRLSWQQIPEASYFNIYRRDNYSDFVRVDSTEESMYIDSNVTKGKHYDYAITQVNLLFPVVESQFSQVVTAKPNMPPKIESFELFGSNRIVIGFSEQISGASYSPQNYFLKPAEMYPESVIRGKNRTEIILGFSSSFESGQNVLIISNIFDEQGTPQKPDSLDIMFNYISQDQTFYLKNVSFVDKSELHLNFNRGVQPESASNIDNYRLEPDCEILYAEVDENDPKKVILVLNKNNRLGSLGVSYFINVNNLLDKNGISLEPGNGDRLAINTDVNELSNVIVYPNPYSRQSANNLIMFANLPKDCEVHIYSASGKYLEKLTVTNNTGGVEWKLKTESGDVIATGIYFFIAKFGDQEFKGKFLIIN